MKIDALLVSAALLVGTAECFAQHPSPLPKRFQGHAATRAALPPTRSRKRPRTTRMDSDGAASAASAAEGRIVPPPPPPGLPPRLQAAVDMLGQDTDLKTKSKLLVELGDAFANTDAAVLPVVVPSDSTAVNEASADGWHAQKVPGCVSEVYVAVRVEESPPPPSRRGGAATAAADYSLGAGGGGGIVSIRGTADARLSRGLLALLALGLQGQSARTVLSLRGKDLAAAVGMRAGLTSSRINGLGNVLGVIQDQVRGHFRRAAATASATAGAADTLRPTLVDLTAVQGATPRVATNAGRVESAAAAAAAPGLREIAVPPPGGAAEALSASPPLARVEAAAAAARGAAPVVAAPPVAATTSAAGLSSSGTAADTSATTTTAGLDPSRSWGDDASSWYPLPGAENEVAMLLSGGVDSSVAMRILQDQGYKIRAFYLKIWLEDELAHLNECPWEEDLAYATAVCEQAGVPLEVVPLQREYWDQVVSYTVREAREGRTPNPDVMCNSRIKFGMFYDHVGKHFRHVATGHYARLEHSGGSDGANTTPSDRSAAAAAAAAGTGETPVRVAAGSDRGRVRLLLSPDAVKDQTYFLCALNQDQLRKALFPLGVYTKDQIRELAESYDLPTKHRKDSQGICFLGKLKFDEFLQHYLGTSPGAIVDQTGRHIGEHKGLWFHTIGQRKGVGPGLVPGVVNLGPWYVADKDMESNVLVVTNDREAIASPREVFRVEALQWISGRPLAELARDGSMRLRVKTRHGPQMRDCLLRLVPEVAPGDGSGRAGVGSPTRGYVNLDSKDSALAPGQFAAFYLGDECVGSGVMCGWSPAAAAAAAVGVVAGGEGGVAAGLESGGGSAALRRLEEERGGVLEYRGTASGAAPAAAMRR
ncbi:unnamed protein product [Ectocarpus sp. 4 AP-2014]